MLSHQPRHLLRWLIFNVRQKPEMSPILQGVISAIILIGALLGYTEYKRRKENPKPDFRYTRILILSLCFIGFAFLIFYLTGIIGIPAKMEQRILFSAVGCWLPTCLIALFSHAKNKDGA
jgi:hypothetical protein